MKRKINFNAGPAMLPAEVLQEAALAIEEYKNTGISILETQHRGKDFEEIIEESKHLVRLLCNIGDDYEVLWMQGGGRLQFSLIPMNFLLHRAAYIDSGHWANQAIESSKFVGDTVTIASTRAINYTQLPKLPKSIDGNFSYLHITTNNTIYGTQWHELPKYDIPLIADMSSDIFSGKRDYTQFDMFYAVAQKNLGIAGNTLVVIKKELLQRQARELAPIFCYNNHVLENSILNTANVFGIYVSLLTLRWINKKTLVQIEKENNQKAKLLYDAIDTNPHFKAYIQEKSDRSIMNVCFTAHDTLIEEKLLDSCSDNNITGIKGHRSIGGFRVSLYNAITMNDVKKLVTLINSIN